MRKIPLLILFLFGINSLLFAQPYARWNESELILDNGIVKRIVKLPGTSGNFITSSYKPVVGGFNYFQPLNSDFQFIFNNVTYSGKEVWRTKDVKLINDSRQGNGAAVTIQSADKKVEVTVKFLLYPDLPVVRKSLVVKNLSSNEAALESVDIEKLSITGYNAPTFSWIFSDYGRRRSIGPFEGDRQDALVIIHNTDWQSGIVIGNEASGVLKRTSFLWELPEICSGLTHKNARYPFRKWIKPQEAFETPQVFTMLYNTAKDPGEVLNTKVPDFIRKHMGIRLSELSGKPTFVYNTWAPFKKEINEKLIMELAKAAADAGMKEFVIDDGWQDNYGDWNVDKTKFPNGLKPVFDYIKSLGMKPGLWVSVGSANEMSKVFHDHPEWFIKDVDGNLTNFHTDGDYDKIRSACYSTGWKDYIKNILLRLIRENGLEYLKLDFAVVTSPYVFDPLRSGCYATNHQNHKDHQESMYVNYEKMWELFDELHAATPDLFIDCTFEAMGGLQLIDYAMLKHAEGNWLSNYEQPDEQGDLRIRNMAWWRSPAIAATALVIGNPAMDDKGWELHIKSLAGALPIMLGDPRKLSAEDLKLYRSYADFLQKMQTKHDIMSYRQDLKGFGEPTEGFWDGYQRINTETKSGGIVGVFRHGAIADQQVITVQYLDPLAVYEIKEGPFGKSIFEASGKILAEKGFLVKLNKAYDGVLFEVVRVSK